MKNSETKIVKLKDLSATMDLGHLIGQNLKGGEVIELNSDLGGGKTTLVKAVVQGAGSDDLVSSPSFTICNQYKAPKFTIYHFDFYRLSDPGIIRQELIEVLNNPDIVVIIEWPAVIEDALPEAKLSIKLQAESENARDAHLSYDETLNYLVKDL